VLLHTLFITVLAYVDIFNRTEPFRWKNVSGTMLEEFRRLSDCFHVNEKLQYFTHFGTFGGFHPASTYYMHLQWGSLTFAPEYQLMRSFISTMQNRKILFVGDSTVVFQYEMLKCMVNDSLNVKHVSMGKTYHGKYVTTRLKLFLSSIDSEYKNGDVIIINQGVHHNVGEFLPESKDHTLKDIASYVNKEYESISKTTKLLWRETLFQGYPAPYSDNGWFHFKMPWDNFTECSTITKEMERGYIKTRKAFVPANTRNEVALGELSSKIPVLNIYAPLAYQHDFNIFHLNTGRDCTHVNVDANIF